MKDCVPAPDFLSDEQRSLIGTLLSAGPVRDLPGPYRMLLDGPAGTGKTTMGRWLVQELSARAASGKHPEYEPWANVQLLSMDSFYPGWDGLAAAQTILEQQILASVKPQYPTWDWELNVPGPAVKIDPTVPLIIEGCGAITPRSYLSAHFTIWVEILDTQRRKDRALGRDGEIFAPHWERWADQEAAHWDASHPRDLADLALFG
ncbi:hypothetical protein [Boudabousia liubingyangii]|nr:hypothetical protein [Boudabousia liubingyangii]